MNYKKIISGDSADHIPPEPFTKEDLIRIILIGFFTMIGMVTFIVVIIGILLRL